MLADIPRRVAAVLMLVAAFCAANAQKRGSVSGHGRCSPVPILIQGRITAIEGKTLTIKPPDAYPGAEGGVHAHFVVTALPVRVDISHARILFPDGKQEDQRALDVGEHVAIVLSSLRSGPPSPGKMPTASEASFACVIERIQTSDKIVTH